MSTPTAFHVLDPQLSDRPPLARTGSYEQALHAARQLQQQVYDQLDANGEGGHRTTLDLANAPTDHAGNPGTPCYRTSINGPRP